MVFYLFFLYNLSNDLNLNSLTRKKWWRSSRLLVWERFIIGRRKGEIIISTPFKTQIRHRYRHDRASNAFEHLVDERHHYLVIGRRING